MALAFLVGEWPLDRIWLDVIVLKWPLKYIGFDVDGTQSRSSRLNNIVFDAVGAQS